MTTSLVLFATVFAACCVESVEATVITLAAGLERGFKCAITGASCAVILLALFSVAGGLPLARLVPVRLLQIVMGIVMLYLGATWGRKAALRLSGHKKIHTEEERAQETREQLRTSQRTGFLVAFQGTTLEMLEIVLISLTAGTASKNLGVAAMAAISAILMVVGIAILSRKHLHRLPETHTKAFVAVLLISFAVFWLGEGWRFFKWPGGDLSLIALMTLVGLTFTASVWILRRWQPIKETAS